VISEHLSDDDQTGRATATTELKMVHKSMFQESISQRVNIDLSQRDDKKERKTRSGSRSQRKSKKDDEDGLVSDRKRRSDKKKEGKSDRKRKTADFENRISERDEGEEEEGQLSSKREKT
jgi:hypothetical protein